MAWAHGGAVYTVFTSTVPLHMSFSGSMDTHTRVLLYGLIVGPFSLLLLVVYLERRRESREDAARAREHRDDPERDG
jgi:hypothetical protein